MPPIQERCTVFRSGAAQRYVRVLWTFVLLTNSNQSTVAFQPCGSFHVHRPVQSTSTVIRGCCSGAGELLRLPFRNYRRHRSQLCTKTNDQSAPHVHVSNNHYSLEKTASHLEKLKRQQRHRRRSSTDSDEQKALEQEYHARSSNNGNSNNNSNDDAEMVPDPMGEERERLYQSHLLKPASVLKMELKNRQLPQKGRKPDLARRLAQNDLVEAYGFTDHGKESFLDDDDDSFFTNDNDDVDNGSRTDAVGKATPFGFANRLLPRPLSEAARTALSRARFAQATPIQAAALTQIALHRQSCILHAATGSGKKTI